MIFKKASKLGLTCEDREDGSRVCKRYKRSNGEKLETGTDVELTPIPSNEGCRVMETGDVNDEDREMIDKEKEKMRNTCRRGF